MPLHEVIRRHWRDALFAVVNAPEPVIRSAERARRGPLVKFTDICTKARALDAYYSERDHTASGLRSIRDIVRHNLVAGGSGTIHDKHAVVDAIRRDAMLFRPQPRQFQRDIIEMWMELSASTIYGDYWRTNKLEIRKRNGWTMHHYGIGALMSGRKDGKSTGLAMCVCLGMMHLPGYQIALLSTKLDQSRIILGMAIKLAHMHTRAHEFVFPRPSKCEFRMIINGIERITTAYGSNAKVSTRACDFFICVWEGSHFFPLSF